MKKDDERSMRLSMALAQITREDLEKLFSELVGRGEAVEKDRDKFITKVLDNFQKRGGDINKKIIKALKATCNPNREEINKRIHELVIEHFIKIDVSYADSNNEIVVLTIHGYVDTLTTPELVKKLEEQFALNKYKIIVHLSDCDLAESVGWGVFVSEIREIREKNGDLVLVNMSPDVYDVYELMEFSSILKSFDSRKDAIAHFSRKLPEQAPASEKEPDIYSLATSELGKRIINIIVDNPYFEPKEIANALKLPQHGGKKAGSDAVKKELRAMGLLDRQQRFELAMKSRK